MRRAKARRSEPAPDPRWTSPLTPAPGDLCIVQAFVATADPARGSDAWPSPQALAGWLEHWRLLAEGDEPLGEEHLARARAVRDALYALIQRRGRADAEAVAVLDREAAGAPLRLRFGPGGATRFEPAAEGFAAALGRLFEIVARARADGLWRRLKTCGEPSCRRVFYDASPNRSGKWCSMQRCGNRHKVSKYRRTTKRRFDEMVRSLAAARSAPASTGKPPQPPRTPPGADGGDPEGERHRQRASGGVDKGQKHQ